MQLTDFAYVANEAWGWNAQFSVFRSKVKILIFMHFIMMFKNRIVTSQFYLQHTYMTEM